MECKNLFINEKKTSPGVVGNDVAALRRKACQRFFDDRKKAQAIKSVTMGEGVTKNLKDYG
jgi:hypothetical protein